MFTRYLLYYFFLSKKPSVMNESTYSFSALQKTVGWVAAGAGLFLVTHALVKEITKFTLAGKVVLITGGSRGLGLVLARSLAAKGARLALCARSADKLELVRQQLEKEGAEVLGLPADVREREQVQAMIRDVIDHYGRLDVLINNAGIIQVGPQETMDVEAYEEAMKTNFWAPLYAIDAVIPHFKKRGEGRIVNITSIGGKIALPHLLPYSASKFAAVGLSEGMHTELKKFNIHVTTVVPNLMRTGSPRNVEVRGDYEEEYAWFKEADSSPWLAQQAELAARNIIKALEYGEPEAILSLSGKLATVIKGIAPGWVSLALGVTNKFLPESVPEHDGSIQGYEAESIRSQRGFSTLTDREALKNNEL
jgi:NAD(P)-dependent dehydrogenase (short-subunit alcohol dehydrogenase family)